MPKRSSEEARMLRELLETAEDLNGYGVMSKTNMAKVRALCAEPPVYTPDRVVSVRTTIAKMSQAVFASFLNVSVSTVQKWESPSADKHPSGAAAKLLQLVESKGVEALIA
jgi:putative transcriptional regulator